MSLLSRLSTGRIMEDDFADGFLQYTWEPSPSDTTRYSVTDRAGSLRLKHGDVPLYLLMDLPNRDFVFEMKNDYNPRVEGDSGGIIAYYNEEQYIQLLEYFDATRGVAINYTHMRMVRKGSVYSGYGSKDGGNTWELIGSTSSDDINKIGLVLNSPSPTTGAVPMDVEYIRIYSDRRILIGNLASGMRIELLRPDNTVVASRTCPPGADHVYLDMTNLPVPFAGKLRVYNSTGDLKETTDELSIWGGDVFWYGLLVEIYNDAGLLPTDRETELGPMLAGHIEMKLTIKNPGAVPITNTIVSVKQFHEFHGHQWVMLADNIGGNPGPYSKSINIGTLYGGEGRPIWVRVSKEFTNDFGFAGDHKFYLEVTN